jgi:hypothetical protein
MANESQTTICPACAGNALTEKDLEALAAFVKEMDGKVIPEIVEALRKRSELANEYRRNNPWM